ncbi:hypothetical protein [Paracidovorax avenae]|uniref:hypothetical protein n=1 Tax=Paracidovorax avenae TaxID=80867 RepID=UPI0012FD2A37|nr:hypothetical protein [Paracidovorax avenae]
MQEEITPLAELISKTYWDEARSGIEFFAQFRSELERVSFVNFSLFILANYHDSFCCDFFLSTPFLWSQKDPSIWIEIIEKNKPRPALPKIKDASGKNSDIVFLQKYVEVDAIRYLISAPNVTETDKKNISEYFQYFWYTLRSNDHDASDLDGIYFVHKKVLNNIKNTLVNDFHLSPA